MLFWIACSSSLRYHDDMVTYAQVKRSPGAPAEIIPLKCPPKDWDESEDKELHQIAQHAGILAWKDSQHTDKDKVSDCRNQMMNELRLSSHE